MAHRERPSAEVLLQFAQRRERVLAHASPKPVLLFALGILGFALWDRWLDPEHAEYALWVRIGTALALLPSYVVLSRGVSDGRAKYVHGSVFLVGFIGVAAASMMLTDGFLWGAGGTLAFPVVLAFYSIPVSFYFALNLIALALILVLAWVLGVPTPQQANFAMMDAVMIWVGSNAGRVLYHQQLRAFVQELRHAEDARTDALTGLSNRRQIDEFGRRALEQARRRDDAPLTVMMIDLDHFKQINDRHGHDAGDAILRSVGEVLRAQLRGSDPVGRWGGEEFLAVLHGAREVTALEIARRMLAAVRGVAAAPPDLEISISIGLAVSRGDDDWHGLVKRADEALYRAKAAGRDRVEVG